VERSRAVDAAAVAAASFHRALLNIYTASWMLLLATCRNGRQMAVVEAAATVALHLCPNCVVYLLLLLAGKAAGGCG
jgi:hypothetical protein